MSFREYQNQWVPQSRILLLDLEGTLIDDWSTRRLLIQNMRKIKESGIITPNTRVGLMSWAIWDSRDKQTAQNTLIGLIQQVLEVVIDPMLPMSMSDYAADILKCRKLLTSKEDMYDMFKKEEVLLSLARFDSRFVDVEVILIDDRVEHNMSIQIPSRNTVVRIIDIEKPVESWIFNR